MIKSQSKAIKAKESKKIYNLTFFQVQIINEMLSDQIYLSVTSLHSQQIWESPKFQNKMSDIWSIQVDSSSVQLALYMKVKQKFILISNKKINEGADTITMSQIAKQSNKTCLIRYQFREVKKLGEKQGGNHFAHDSNIFDSFLNDNQISRVEPVKTKSKAHQISYERIRFDGESFISSAPSMIKQQQQDGDNQNYKKDKQVSDQRQRLSNYSIKDSVIESKPHNDEDQRQRFSHSYSQNLNISLSDSKSDIKQIINIIEPKKSTQLKQQAKENKKQGKKQGKKQVKEAVPIKIDNKKVDKNENGIENENEKQQQESQFINTAEKWYRNRFNKKNLKMKKKSIHELPKQKEESNPKAIEVRAYNTELIQREENLRQITDISVQDPIKLKSIDFSLSQDGGSKKLYSLSRNDGKQSSLWYTNITLPSDGTIIIQCQTQNKGLNGCLGSQEMKKSQCPLYDEEGRINGNLNFKWKSVSNFNVQTIQVLQKNNSIDSNLKEGHTQKDAEKKQNKIKINKEEKEEEEEKEKEDGQGDENVNEQESLIENQGHLERHNTPQNNCNKYESASENPENNKESKAQNQEQKNEENKFNIELIQTSSQRNEKRSPIHSLQSWRKLRYTDSPRIQEQNNSQQYSSNQNKEKETIQMEGLLKTMSPQIKKTMEKQYETSRMNTIKQKMRNVPTIDLKIENNSSFASSISGPIVHRHDRRLSQRYPSENYAEHTHKSNQPAQNNRLESQPNSIESSNVQQIPQNNHSFSYRLNKSKDIQPIHTTGRDRNSFHLQSNYNDKEENSEIYEHEQPAYVEDYQKRNQSQVSKKKPKKNEKVINLKISSIQLRLQNPSYYGKLLQIKIGDKKFITETNRGICLLDWKGNGRYFFIKVSEYSKLEIDFIEEREQGKVLVAQCKIHLVFISSNKPNQVFQHVDFIRNQNQESLGRLNINFEIIERRGRSLQGNGITNDRMIEDMDMVNQRRIISQNKKRKNRNSTRISTQNTKNYYEGKVPMNIGKEQYGIDENAFSKLKPKPPLTKRKYTGGNTLIPKASRFKQVKQEKLSVAPGPGAYNFESSFDRHASPL